MHLVQYVTGEGVAKVFPAWRTPSRDKELCTYLAGDEPQVFFIRFHYETPPKISLARSAREEVMFFCLYLLASEPGCAGMAQYGTLAVWENILFAFFAEGARDFCTKKVFS